MAKFRRDTRKFIGPAISRYRVIRAVVCLSVRQQCFEFSCTRKNPHFPHTHTKIDLPDAIKKKFANGGVMVSNDVSPSIRQILSSEF